MCILYQRDSTDSVVFLLATLLNNVLLNTDDKRKENYEFGLFYAWISAVLNGLDSLTFGVFFFIFYFRSLFYTRQVFFFFHKSRNVNKKTKMVTNVGSWIKILERVLLSLSIWHKPFDQTILSATYRCNILSLQNNTFFMN